VFVGCRAGSTTTSTGAFRRATSDRARRHRPDGDLGELPHGARAGRRRAPRAGGAARASGSELEQAGAPPTSTARRWSRAHAGRSSTPFRARAEDGERPIRPERVLAELHRVLPRDSIVVADPGTPCPMSRAITSWSRRGRRFITNRAHGALGYSLAAATGRGTAARARSALALMATAASACASRAGDARALQVPLLLIVFSNATFGWIKASQKSELRPALLLGGFRPHRQRPHRRSLRRQGVAGRTIPRRSARCCGRRPSMAAPALVDVIAQSLEDCPAPVLQWMG